MNEKVKDHIFEFERLSNVLFNVLEQIEGKENTFGRSEGRFLGMKFFSHIFSIRHLLKGYFIGNLPDRFFDCLSVAVLARAAMEACLNFRYVFIDVSNQEEREFRLLIWKHASFQEFDKHTLDSSQMRLAKARNKEELENTKQSILNHTYYRKLDAKERPSFLQRGFSAKKMEETVFGSEHLKKGVGYGLYKYLSEHSHSGWQNITRVVSSSQSDMPEQVLPNCLNVLLLCLAKFIQGMCVFFDIDIEDVAQEEDLHLIRICS